MTATGFVGRDFKSENANANAKGEKDDKKPKVSAMKSEHKELNDKQYATPPAGFRTSHL